MLNRKTIRELEMLKPIVGQILYNDTSYPTSHSDVLFFLIEFHEKNFVLEDPIIESKISHKIESSVKNS